MQATDLENVRGTKRCTRKQKKNNLYFTYIMSFLTNSTNHGFLHVYMASNLQNSTNYGGGSGFPFDTVEESFGNISWNNTTKTATINKAGTYFVAYSYSLRNQNDTDGSEIASFGIQHYDSSTISNNSYTQEVSVEWFGDTVRQSISNSFVIRLDVNDTIKGLVAGRTTEQVIEGGIGKTYLSIGLITPYTI